MAQQLPASLEQLRKLVGDLRSALMVAQQHGSLGEVEIDILERDIRALDTDAEWLIGRWQRRYEVL